jgi:Domain of unknown function (DUF5615)
VKILLDECIDWRLSREIHGHDVRTAGQMGWTGVKNGELLARAASEFDVFVTVDRNLSFQQNVANLTLAVVVLRAKSNRLGDLQPLVQGLISAANSAKPGTVTVVG